MATSNKKLNDELRNKYLEMLKTFFDENGEKVKNQLQAHIKCGILR